MATSQKVAEAYVELTARTAAFKKAIDDANDQIRGFSRQMKQSSEEARASIALLSEELGVGLPRHLQKFAAELPGVATAMSAAFNGVAIVILIEKLVEAGEKVAEFVQKNREAAEKADAAWRDFGGGLTSSNDQLRAQNDQLERSIARLEHKPENGLKAVIDDTILAVDDLSKHLDSTLGKANELVKAQAVSLMSQLGGNATTSDIENKQADLSARITEAQTRGNLAVHDAAKSGDPKAVAAAKQKMDAELSKLYDEGTKFFADVYKGASAAKQAQQDYAAGKQVRPEDIGGFNSQNMDGRIRLSSGLLQFYSAQQDELGLRNQNATDKSKLSGFQGSQAAVEAQRKADQQLIASYRERVEQIKAWDGMSATAERDSWQHLVDSVKAGSTTYTLASDEVTKANLRIRQEQGQTLGQLISQSYGDQAKKIAEQTPQSPSDFFDQQQKQDAERTKQQQQAALETFKAAQARIDADLKIKEAQLRALESQGRLSQREAALAMQVLHQRANDQWMNAYGTAQNNGAAMPSQVYSQHAGQVGAQAMQDQVATHSGTLIDSLDRLASEFTNFSGMLSNTVIESLNTFNQTVVQVISGNRQTRFSDVGSAMFKGFAGDALKGSEGSIMKALGIGDHNKVQAVKVTNWPGGMGDGSTSVGSTAGGLIGMLNDSDWASSLFGGKLFGSGSFFGGGHALGGDVVGGLSYTVGELGPETLTMPVGSSGSITPHNQTGGGHTVHIDARGSSDPAATEAAVHRAMGQYLPAMGAVAQHSVRDSRRRSIGGRS